jgi:hypothetical protein
MAEGNDGQSSELTVMGLKRRWRLRFPGGVAAMPVARVDRRQGGGGALGVLHARKNGHREKNLGRR